MFTMLGYSIQSPIFSLSNITPYLYLPDISMAIQGKSFGSRHIYIEKKQLYINMWQLYCHINWLCHIYKYYIYNRTYWQMMPDIESS